MKCTSPIGLAALTVTLSLVLLVALNPCIHPGAALAQSPPAIEPDDHAPPSYAAASACQVMLPIVLNSYAAPAPATATNTPGATPTPTSTATPPGTATATPTTPPTATATATPTVSPTPNPNEVRSAWSGSPKVIDGVLSPGEWDAAGALAAGWGRVFFANSASVLYVAHDITADTERDAWEQGDVYLDGSQVGRLEAGHDPVIGWADMLPQDISISPFRRFTTNGCEWQGYLYAGHAAVSYATGHRVVEWWVSLGDVQAAPGATVGLMVFVLGAGDDPATWPPGADQCSPAHWGALVLATEP